MRAHGQSEGEELANEKGKEFNNPATLEPDRALNLTRAFQRLRTDWNSTDKDIITSAQFAIEGMIRKEFADAFALINEVYIFVREPEVDENGEIVFDQWKFPAWKKYPEGGYVEDWSALSNKQVKEFIYKMAFSQFAWEQKASDIWFEALIAKHKWEEAFAVAFDTTEGKATDKSKEARADRVTADERYLAVCKSLYSRKAEAIVRSMDRIHQRLKDLLQ